MGFCIGAVFTEKKIGAYISYELIVRNEVEFDAIYFQ